MLNLQELMRGRLLPFIFLKLSLFFFSAFAYGQQILIVQDESGIALPGAVVLVDDIPKTTTDIDGKAVINEQIASIDIDFLGYERMSFNLQDVSVSPFIIRLKKEGQILNEIVLVGRSYVKQNETPNQLKIITSKDIQSLSSQTSADVLEKSGAAYIQRSQMGGGSPILRGFEANKVLLVVDGVRMNNLIYRNGHLQNAITVDKSVLKQLEVLYGANSLLFGSDALGGVIHFKTKDPILSTQTYRKTNANIRYASANQEKSIHYDYAYGKEKFGYLTSVSYSDYGDLRMGKNRTNSYPEFGKRNYYVESDEFWNDIIIENDNPNSQKFTGFKQWDFLQKFVFKPTNYLKFALNLQFSSSSEIPRYDALIEATDGIPTFAKWSYGPQERFLLSPRMEINKKTVLFDNLMWIGAFQKLEESRLTRRLFSPVEEMNIEEVDIFSNTIDATKEVWKNMSINYGLSMHINDLNSTSRTEDVNGNEQYKILSRYPSKDADMTQVGIYLKHNWTLNNVVKWINGARFSSQKTNFIYDENDPFQWPDFYYSNINNNNKAITWNSGLHMEKNGYLFKALVGTAFRAPNIDDLAKVRVKNNEITIPNPGLKPENTFNLEASFGIQKQKYSLSITAFDTKLKDAIVRRNFNLPNGDDMFFSNGDSLLVMANINANKANVRGVSLNGRINYSNLVFSGNINYTEGNATSEGVTQALDHIPPLYGKIGIAYKSEKYSLDIHYLYNGKKPLEKYGGSADNPEFATVEGALAWSTYNISAEWRANDNFNLRCGIDNIFDKHYRAFASGLSGAGRNLFASIHCSF